MRRFTRGSNRKSKVANSTDTEPFFSVVPFSNSISEFQTIQSLNL